MPTPISKSRIADQQPLRPQEMRLARMAALRVESHKSENRLANWSTTTLAILASMAVLYFSRAIALPIVLAAILNLIFKPLIVRVVRRGVTPAAAAAILMAGLLAFLVLGVALLWNPATEWIDNLPRIREELAEKLRPLRQPVEKIAAASSEVEKIAGIEGDSTPRVQVEQPGIASFLLNTSGGILGSVALTMTLLYFLLAGGDRFLEKAVSLATTFRGKKNVVELVRSIEESISGYLLTITWINAGLGVAIGVAMAALGLPNPLLWGVMAFLLNFIPFVGAAVGALVVFTVGLLEYHLGYAFAALAAYVAINALEANFITPLMLGRANSLSPVAIILSLTLWGWMWGVGGCLVAVPLLVIAKISCDHVENLRPFGLLLEA